MPAKTRLKSLLLRLPPSVHRRLIVAAREQELSLNSLCLKLITSGLEARTAGSYEKLRQLLEHEWPNQVSGIILFGSAARGDLRHHSDIDLLIVLDGKLPITRELYRRWDQGIDQTMRELLMREVNPHFVHLPTGPAGAGGIWLENALEGQVIFDRDGDIERCLRNLRNYIVKGGAERLSIHGHPYWVTARQD